MCGRFSISTPLEEIRERFAVDVPEELYRPRYNAAPSQDMLVVPQESPQKAAFYHWGLVPSWAKDPKIGNRLINARAETVAEKPAFRSAFKNHRCLVLADGFYEWDKKHEKKTPYRVTLKGEEPFAFAGICESWEDAKGHELKSFSIITTEANSLVSKIHDRMPVILSPKEEEKWLDPGLEPEKAQKLLKPYPPGKMEMYPISTLVNNPKNDVAEVLKKV